MAEPCRSVLMTTDAVGGVWNYSIGLAHELVRYRIATTLVVIGPPPNDVQRDQASSIPGLRLFECSEALEWMDDPWEGVVRSGQKLLELARQIQPDILHLNGYSHAALPFECPTLVVAHSCVLSWWEAVKGVPAPARYEKYRRSVKAGLERASQIVAPSNAMLRALRRHYDVRGGAVIYNGVEPCTTINADKQNMVFCAGRLWDEGKNVAALNAVAKELEVPIYVAGANGEHVDGLIPLGVLDSTQLEQWYDRAAIYASPAYYEPFGLAALEAGARGAALVLGDIESQRELWSNAALYVPPQDTAALRRAIALLARNPGFREIMSHRARKRAERYTIAVQGQHYIELYSKLLRRNGSARAWSETARASDVAI